MCWVCLINVFFYLIFLKNIIVCRFIKIDERNAGSEYFNILDSTWVHPESYDLAEK